eukprot:130070-Pleurochrysis_carterae.AAC.1
MLDDDDGDFGGHSTTEMEEQLPKFRVSGCYAPNVQRPRFDASRVQPPACGVTETSEQQVQRTAAKRTLRL